MYFLLKKILFRKIFTVLKPVFLLKRIVRVFNSFDIIYLQANNLLCCGLCSIISIKKKLPCEKLETETLIKNVKFVTSQNSSLFKSQDLEILIKGYLGGNALKSLFYKVRLFRKDLNFLDLFFSKKNKKNLFLASRMLSNTLVSESLFLKKEAGILDTNIISFMKERLEIVKDVIWCISSELLGNINKVERIIQGDICCNKHSVLIFKQINTILNSLDRLEVRGRDSAGISILFILSVDAFNMFKRKMSSIALEKEFEQRQIDELLSNKNISYNKIKTDNNKETIAIAMTYKVASEVGSLGDNTNFLREEIKKDKILSLLTSVPRLHHSISSHTRWASVGAITEPNCHPIDNLINISPRKHIIHVCLNGEIDNYLEFKKNSSKIKSTRIQREITTDTKIIPLALEEYISQGVDIVEAFRLAVNSFKGSHAIIMHTDLAPGRLFVAQKGSGQGMFIGLTENSYIPTSEVYGFIEDTSSFLRMAGHKIIRNKLGKKVQGQIFILDQKSEGKVENIIAMYYDGTPVKITQSDIKITKITSKDVARKDYKHFFLKEIYESPRSVQQTIDGNWYLEQKHENNKYVINLNKKTIPNSIRKALKQGLIKNIFFIGQGTSGIAANACSNILSDFLINTSIRVNSLRASEFSGFEFNKYPDNTNFEDTLVIAISQSGTTTDTNRSVDIANLKNAYTIAIVNRRDSDITFKVNGIMYTSSGRDVEMSVASTKAFYSQITAGVLLCLQIVKLTQARTEKFISVNLETILKLPKQMEKIINTEQSIKKSALRLSFKKKYWATVGSGPNKVSADEVRIKLSELCYKTISSDFIEDKKHIDLSSEPLILVFAAGYEDDIMDDVIKDTAIFKAHKAITIVITHEGETRFQPYAENVFYVPKTISYLAPILNTLVGHIWGYHAAISINKVSESLSNFRDSLKEIIDRYSLNGIDIFEIVRKKSFRSKVNKFYRGLRIKMRNNKFPLEFTNSTDLIILLKYLSGKLPVSDFEIDFGKKGTAIEILQCFFKRIDFSISDMSRPIDAIRHQAKTVTVGTTRVNSRIDGVLFKIIKNHGITLSQVTDKNVVVIKNLQKVIEAVQGSVLYNITKLNSLGEPDSSTQIKIENRSGILKSIPSRVEKDNYLKGIKRTVVSSGETYVGKGRKDNENVVIIPVFSNISHEFGRIHYLLLLNIIFKKFILLKTKIIALGDKYDSIKNIVHENTIPWKDEYINNIKTDNLFGFSAEKIGEYIVSKQKCKCNGSNNVNKFDLK